jgi:hypothetical protein
MTTSRILKPYSKQSPEEPGTFSRVDLREQVLVFLEKHHFWDIVVDGNITMAEAKVKDFMSGEEFPDTHPGVRIEVMHLDFIHVGKGKIKELRVSIPWDTFQHVELWAEEGELARVAFRLENEEFVELSCSII